MAAKDDLIERLLREAGTTYAQEAGITLKDTPMPLFQLLVLCMLASKPIEAGIAVRAAQELFHAGLRTPDAVRDADRRTVIDAFGRAGYTRYDESSADRLIDIATMIEQEHRGDLRRLAEDADGDVSAAARALQRFKGIGETGAGIFLREVQDTWTWVRPYFDDRALAAAEDLGLPRDAAKLGMAAPQRNAALAAALVRVTLDDGLRDELTRSG